MAEYDVTIYVRMSGTENQVNDRIDKALNRAFPPSRKDVLGLSWEAREDTLSSSENMAREGGLADG